MKSRYEQVETGIYRYRSKDGEITCHERPIINGKRTYRSLGFNFVKQTSLKLAREEYHRRRTEVAAGKNPYEEKKPAQQQMQPSPDKPTVSKIIQHYRDAGYPDRYLQKRIGKTLRGETDNCKTLLEYWNGQLWDTLTPKSWDGYQNRLSGWLGADGTGGNGLAGGVGGPDNTNTDTLINPRYATRRGCAGVRPEPSLLSAGSNRLHELLGRLQLPVARRQQRTVRFRKRNPVGLFVAHVPNF